MINKQLVLDSLNYAEDARLPKNRLERKHPGAVFIEDKETDTQCYVYSKSDKETIVAFRGTQQMRDILTDVNAFHMIYPYGNLYTKIMVHRGFMNAYLAVRERIQNCISLITNEDHIVTIVGHSLGGSLALLCAVDLQYNFSFKIQCYVSGNPMVGNKAWVESYNSRVPDTTRTYMRNDPVPSCPPEGFEKLSYGGYSHAGKPFAIGPRSPFYGLIMMFKKKYWKESILDDIFNHDIGLYRDEIKKKC